MRGLGVGRRRLDVGVDAGDPDLGQDLALQPLDRLRGLAHGRVLRQAHVQRHGAAGGVLEHRDVVGLHHAGDAQRRGRDALVGALLGQGRRLDVHLHLRPPERVAHGLLDPVRRVVHLLEPVEPGDADDDVGEALSARLADAHRAHVDDAVHPPHDLLDDAGLAQRRPVHQHADVAGRQPDGGDQHDRGDEDPGDRVAAGEARRGQAEADEDRQRADEVAAEVPRVRDQRGVSLPPALLQRQRRPGGVDREHEQDDGEDVRAGVDRRAARAQAHDGLDGDPDRGAGEERGLAQRGQVLGLAVAVGVLAIRRPFGDADGIEREHGGHRVDARVRGFGEHAQAPAGEPDHCLHHDEDDGCDERDQRRAPRGRHAAIVFGRGVSFFRPEVQ